MKKVLLLLLICLLFLLAVALYYFAPLFAPQETTVNDKSANQKSSIAKTSINSSQLRQQTIDPYPQSPIKNSQSTAGKIDTDKNSESTTQIPNPSIPAKELSFQDYLALQAEKRLQSDVTYDGSYHKIAYPMGDVPSHIGVCTDVVIRSFRGLGIDLQERVHKDMKRYFHRYPRKWNLSKPDANIDHRRVLNLMTYFERKGTILAITNDAFDYIAGNVVTWDLGKGLYHIGIVSKYVSEYTGNPLIIHNIGAGIEMNDILFKYKIIGHYQYGDLEMVSR